MIKVIDSPKKQCATCQLFSKIVAKESLRHAYLLEGVAGAGKVDVAKYVAKLLFCSNLSKVNEPCDTCAQCQKINTNQHIDVIHLEKTGATIKVDQIRELKQTVSKSGVEGRQKVIIINEAETMTTSASNSLLKMLEEPDGEVVIFLLTSSKQNLLPTIISRCQVLSLKAQPILERIRLLTAEGMTPVQASLVAHLTEDNQQAKTLIDETNLMTLAESIWQWFKYINQHDDQAFIYVTSNLMPLVKEQKDTAIVLSVILLLYRDILKISVRSKPVLAFSSYRDQLKSLSSEWSLAKVNEAIQFILHAHKMADHYVTIQGVLENLTLQLMNN